MKRLLGVSGWLSGLRRQTQKTIGLSLTPFHITGGKEVDLGQISTLKSIRNKGRSLSPNKGGAHPYGEGDSLNTWPGISC